MAGSNTAPSGRNKKMSVSRGLDTEKWVAILVLGSLALLIGIRLGFRGVSFMGVSASVS